MEPTQHGLYQVMFREYPDVMDVKQVSTALDVSTKTVYRLIKDGEIPSLKIGREFRISKVAMMNYLNIFDSVIKDSEHSMPQ